jgi:hypothetical protein
VGLGIFLNILEHTSDAFMDAEVFVDFLWSVVTP